MGKIYTPIKRKHRRFFTMPPSTVGLKFRMTSTTEEISYTPTDLNDKSGYKVVPQRMILAPKWVGMDDGEKWMREEREGVWVFRRVQAEPAEAGASA